MRLVIIFLLLIFASPSYAADFYIAQSAAGDEGGSSCANAHAIAGLTWNGGDIDDGDTLHLCGTITSSLVIGDSGSNGSPYTVLFETDAKFSADHWEQSGSNGDAAIYGSSKSYITIDGGTNGLIEATDNGTALTYQASCSGIRFDGSSNIIVKDISVYPMYVRVEGTENNSYGRGVWFKEISTNVTVQDSTINNAADGVAVHYRAGASGAYISGNTFDDCGHACVSIGSLGVNETISTVLIHHNNFSRGRLWGGQPLIHTNMIHAYATQSGAELTGLKIYNNYFSGQCGLTATSFCFVEAHVTSPELYNNIFIKEVETGEAACGNGAMFIKDVSGALVYNNTFVGVAGQTALGLQINGSGSIIKNNIFRNTVTTISTPYDKTSIAECDYNLFYDGGSAIFNWGSWGQLKYADWLTNTAADGFTFDANSVTGDPSLNANYKPNNTNDPGVDAGADLSATLTDDKDGVTRPTNGGNSNSFDMGAYEYDPGVTPESTGNHEVSGATSLSGVTIQ